MVKLAVQAVWPLGNPKRFLLGRNEQSLTFSRILGFRFATRPSALKNWRELWNQRWLGKRNLDQGSQKLLITGCPRPYSLY